MSDSAHAFLAPSSAHIWGPDGCAYNPTISARYPQTGDDPEAREGSAAHHLLAARLWGVVIEVGELAPNGEPITQEMFDCTDDFVASVEKLRREFPDLEERVEERVDMPQIHPTANWGTADWFAISRSAKRIWWKDYKHGHMYVDAWENWQLVDYGVGGINHFGVNLTAEWGLTFAIYQPRCFNGGDGPIKSWPVDYARFLLLSTQLRAAATEAMGLDPQMRTGPHCTFCSGNTHCPAFRRSAENGIDLSLRAVPDEMDNAARGTFRSQVAAAIKRLEGMATGLDADIEAEIRSGQVVPGWELKPGHPRLAWSLPLSEVYALGDMMGVELRKEAAITPTQAINNGIDEAVIMEYAKRPPAALKVAQSDKSSAAKAFK